MKFKVGDKVTINKRIIDEIEGELIRKGTCGKVVDIEHDDPFPYSVRVRKNTLPPYYENCILCRARELDKR